MPHHHKPLAAQTIGQMVDQVLSMEENSKLLMLAPIIKEKKGEHLHVMDRLRKEGFIRARIDGIVVELDEAPHLEKNKNIPSKPCRSIQGKAGHCPSTGRVFETALELSEGIAIIAPFENGDEVIFSSKFACPLCGYSIQELEPRLFSLTIPMGPVQTATGWA